MSMFTSGLWLFPGEFLVVPAIVWFVKVQGALNGYCEAKAVCLRLRMPPTGFEPVRRP
jgi:hypothetical protein